MEQGRNVEDRWQDQWMATVYQFARALNDAHQNNPWPELALLPQAMDYFMTELWDLGFSQSEIAEAFGRALSNLPKYAAGER
jgi:hypothetical protein